jgi:hypothetical protein
MDRVFGSDRLTDDAMPEQDRIGLALAGRTMSSEIAEERKLLMAAAHSSRN